MCQRETRGIDFEDMTVVVGLYYPECHRQDARRERALEELTHAETDSGTS